MGRRKYSFYTLRAGTPHQAGARHHCGRRSLICLATIGPRRRGLGSQPTLTNPLSRPLSGPAAAPAARSGPLACRIPKASWARKSPISTVLCDSWEFSTGFHPTPTSSRSGWPCGQINRTKPNRTPEGITPPPGQIAQRSGSATLWPRMGFQGFRGCAQANLAFPQRGLIGLALVPPELVFACYKRTDPRKAPRFLVNHRHGATEQPLHLIAEAAKRYLTRSSATRCRLT